MDENNIEAVLNKIDIKIICIYLVIVSSILYLILYYEQKAKITDRIYNTNTQSLFPNTENYNQIIVAISIITSGIFLYYSYKELCNQIEIYKKTGMNTGLDSAYNSFYANLLDFSGTLIVLYNNLFNDSNIKTTPPLF